MTRKRSVKLTLVSALFLLSLGGWLLHLRSHPPGGHGANVIPFIAGIIGVLALPLLFWFKRTLVLAYLINGFSVIIGTITMTHFSVVHFKEPVSLRGLLLGTTLPYIVLLWGKFAAGKAIFDLEPLRSDADGTIKDRFFRYPNMGWWWVHLVSIAIVYALGNILWR